MAHKKEHHKKHGLSPRIQSYEPFTLDRRQRIRCHSEEWDLL